MTFFSGKISIITPKNSDDLFFFSHRPDFLIFPFFFQILRIFTVLNVVYAPFFTRKTTISEKNFLTTPFFTLFVLSRASDNTTSQNIGGTDACLERVMRSAARLIGKIQKFDHVTRYMLDVLHWLPVR